jgi:hypothetical protein
VNLLVVLVFCGAFYCAAGFAASAIERYELMKRQRAFNNRVTRAQSNVWGDCEYCGSAVGEVHDCQDIRRCQDSATFAASC